MARALRCVGAEARILEPSGRLLSQWEQRAAAVGMTRMRSPVTHHLEDHETDLHHFAEVAARDLKAPFHGPYKRPSLELFARHCAAVIERHGLARWVWPGSAVALQRVEGGLRVLTDRGSVVARQVVLATGQTEAEPPPWAQALREQGGAVEHVLGRSFERSAAAGSRWAVIGAGISGAQLALRLIAAGAAPVTVVSREPLRCAELDTDPRWTRVGSLRLWSRLDPPSRARLLLRARYRGSLPPAVWERMQREQRRGRLCLVQGEPCDVAVGEGRVHLRLRERLLVVDRVVLATGLRPPLPAQRWLAAAAEGLGLPLAPGHAPATGPSLAWGPGLYVTGALAEQALGPVAPNLLGARWAAPDRGSGVRRRLTAVAARRRRSRRRRRCPCLAPPRGRPRAAARRGARRTRG